ncbi:heme NO-binding domain-containing protein [Thermodesulfobacteriota bacterium B35]
MKGIIFNLLEDYIASNHGEEAYERLLARCSLKTGEPLLMVAPGTYPDEDFHEIVRQAAAAGHLPVDDFYRDFGRFAIPRMADRYPDFFAPFHHPKDFLKFTGMVHLVEVKKLYKDAQVPDFTCRDTGPDTLLLRYTSERMLCRLVEGLIEGVAEYYNVPIRCRQTRCQRRGDMTCEFSIHFAEGSGRESADGQRSR